MTAPLSQDLRERIVQAVEGGSTIRQAARRFAVSASAAIKLMQRVRQTGSTAPAKIGGYRRPLLEKHADDLRAIVSSKAGITLREIKAAPCGPRHRREGAVHHRRHAPSARLVAQKKSLRASEQDRPDVARHRRRWRVWQRYMDADRFVFIDETSRDHSDDPPLRLGPQGRAPGRCGALGHWKTTTVVAGLRASGIIAPFVLDGPMTGEAFRAYVEQVLAPELEPGDAVVMDNLSAHKVAGVQEAIRAAGASVLYLPSYSPGSQPDRATLRQAQGSAQEGGRKNSECSLGDDRHPARRLYARRMPELHRQFRI